MNAARAGRWFGLALIAAASNARAEDLTLMLSTQDVAIAQNYTGARVSIFGAIERDFTAVSRPSKYDVVISVSGPASPLMVREKDHIGPLWINRTLYRYADVPGYYALFSTGPILSIANEAARERGRMGLTYMLPPLSQLPTEINPDKVAREAMFRLMRKQKLLVEEPQGIQMPKGNLFTAAIPLPAQTPTGRYLVSVTVLADGVPLKTTSTSFVVRKIGFEAHMAAYARDHGWIYGIGTALTAILLGLGSTMLFRRN